MKIEYTYFVQNGNDYTATRRRPAADVMAYLDEQVRYFMQDAKRHEPGMGWHYIPGPVSLVLQDTEGLAQGRWYYRPVTSERAILAHCEDICRIKGLDLSVLYAQAYPEEGALTSTAEDHAQCVRPATLDDIEAVLDDLTDVNYHSLRKVLGRRLL